MRYSIKTTEQPCDVVRSSAAKTDDQVDGKQAMLNRPNNVTTDKRAAVCKFIPL